MDYLPLSSMDYLPFRVKQLSIIGAPVYYGAGCTILALEKLMMRVSHTNERVRAGEDSHYLRMPTFHSMGATDSRLEPGVTAKSTAARRRRGVPTYIF